jgi:hypothetical protein
MKALQKSLTGLVVLVLVACIVITSLSLARQQRMQLRLEKIEKSVVALREAEKQSRAKSLESEKQSRVKSLEQAELWERSILEEVKDVLGIFWIHCSERNDQTTKECRDAMTKLRGRQDGLEAFWAQKGELLPAIPRRPLRTATFYLGKEMNRYHSKRLEQACYCSRTTQVLL